MRLIVHVSAETLRLAARPGIGSPAACQELFTGVPVNPSSLLDLVLQ